MPKDVFGDEVPLGGTPAPSRAQGSARSPFAGRWSGAPVPRDAGPLGPQFGGAGPAGTAAESAGAGSARVVRPTGWLVLAGGCVTGSLVLGLLAAGRPLLAVLGWLLGGFLAFGLLALYVLADVRSRVDPWTTRSRLAEQLRYVAVCAGVAAVALNAWQFADWVSRR